MIDLCGNKFETNEDAVFFLNRTKFKNWYRKYKFKSTLEIRILLYQNCIGSFKEWFRPSLIKWHIESAFLCKYAFEYFDTWWNKSKFIYQPNLFILSQFCYKHFDKWITPNLPVTKYNKRGEIYYKIDIHGNSSNQFNKWCKQHKYKLKFVQRRYMADE